jgi:hypothetical protein
MMFADDLDGLIRKARVLQASIETAEVELLEAKEAIKRLFQERGLSRFEVDGRAAVVSTGNHSTLNRLLLIQNGVDPAIIERSMKVAPVVSLQLEPTKREK